MQMLWDRDLPTLRRVVNIADPAIQTFVFTPKRESALSSSVQIGNRILPSGSIVKILIPYGKEWLVQSSKDESAYFVPAR